MTLSLMYNLFLRRFLHIVSVTLGLNESNWLCFVLLYNHYITLQVYMCEFNWWEGTEKHLQFCSTCVLSCHDWFSWLQWLQRKAWHVLNPDTQCTSYSPNDRRWSKYRSLIVALIKIPHTYISLILDQPSIIKSMYHSWWLCVCGSEVQLCCFSAAVGWVTGLLTLLLSSAQTRWKTSWEEAQLHAPPVWRLFSFRMRKEQILLSLVSLFICMGELRSFC